MRVAEPEFAFRMASDLPPRSVALHGAGGARCGRHAASGDRNSGFAVLRISSAREPSRSSRTMPARICSFSARRASSNWRALDLVEERPVITLRGKQFIGHGKNVLGDPRIALAWLANELRAARPDAARRRGRDHRHLPSAAADSVRRCVRGRFRRDREGVGGVRVDGGHASRHPSVRAERTLRGRRASKMCGNVSRSSFDGCPAVQVHRKARASG